MSNLPQHYVNIYEKPKLGNAPVGRFLANSYKHRIAAQGWFDNASFEVAVKPSKSRAFLDQYLGNRVAVYAESWPEAIWEGFINRMSFSAGGIEYSISLDDMMNQAIVMYTNTAVAGTTPAITTGANNTPSILLYGVKRKVIDMGAQAGGTGSATGINAFRDTLVVQLGDPKASQRKGGSNSLVKIECKGFYHTLTWDTYREVTAAVSALNTFITGFLLPAMQNANVFFSTTDFTEITANALTIARSKQREITYWDLLQEVAEIGNAVDPYIVGVTPTNRNTGVRRLYYRAANLATTGYYARQAEGLRIRGPNQRLIPPWAIVPDQVLLMSDGIAGWQGQGANPNEIYIQAVDYDAVRQSVQITGDDDTTMEGVMQIKRYGKSTNTRYGARRFN